MYYFFNGYYPFRDYYMRGDKYKFNGAITVGALSPHSNQGKSNFSNWGPGVDVYAAGDNLMGAGDKNEIAYGVPYYGQENNADTWDTMVPGQGTSYSAPFIAGILACLAEVYPNLTQAQAKEYLRNNAITGLMYDSADGLTADNQTRVSIDGSDIDRIALWKNHRQTSGNMAFNTYNQNVNNRPTSGLMYPRTNTRRRG